MKRFWIFGTVATVVLMSTILIFASSSVINAGVTPEKEDAQLAESQRKKENARLAESQHKKEDVQLSESQLKMRDNNNDFACNLFRTITKQKKGSTIVSPISVSYLLGMLNEGADGYTRQQITDVLGLGGSVKEINEYFKKMMNEASNIDPCVTVKIANCIDVNSAMHISLIPQYKADMQKYYNAQIDALDFSDLSSLRHINNWCKTHTEGMIPQILSEKEFEPSTVMYLLNAVYFKASWAWEFDPEDTRDMNFTRENGTTVKRKMMHRGIETAYCKNDLCEMVCLPYGCDSWSMYVLLPNKGKTIGDIIRSLSAKKLEALRNNMSYYDHVDILLPRFATESETPLESVLSSMGMPSAFSGGAEFPNMAQGHKDDLYVEMMKQKAKIEVNEEGSEAAAITIAGMMTLSARIDEEPRTAKFHATHPFVYYIVEKSTGAIFFLGTYYGD